MNKKSNILLIYTGGTIGMIKDFETGALRNFNFKDLLEYIPELKLLDCDIATTSFENPLDSSNMKPSYWVDIVTIIEENTIVLTVLWFFTEVIRCLIQHQP